MRRISLLLAIIVLVAGVSVQAQKKGGIQPVSPPVPRQLCVQDQDGGGFIVFDLNSGEFKCSMCEYKYGYSGTGEVKVEGFNVYLTAVTDAYQIFVTINMWERSGRTVMEIYESPEGKSIEPFKEFWTDVNIDNNSMNCAVIQPKK
jgi:hypothetical protein